MLPLSFFSHSILLLPKLKSFPLSFPPPKRLLTPHLSAFNSNFEKYTEMGRSKGTSLTDTANTQLKLYNSMTREKEIFSPMVPGKVKMYVCGVTSYDFSHLGHARAAVAFDVMFRYLQHIGYEVTYVRNFTDVDDKIIRRANEMGEKPLALSDRFCKEYLADMANLQCLDPTHQPRVTDHIKPIIDMISQIINNGYAYEVEGDVYFSVGCFPHYYVLSKRAPEDNRAGERVAVDSRKRNPSDFALWKAAKPGEPSWESPWGPGRPGWHIECSAMSAKYLSFKFDIHGGGCDLIFPHHENELAQSRAAHQECHVSYWVHNGHVTNNNLKMSKSLGNFFTLREITERYHPLALRYFLMSAHYRSNLNYSVPQLEVASELLFYTYQTLQACEEALMPFHGSRGNNGVQCNKTVKGSAKVVKKLREEFRNHMSDDLNVPPFLDGAFHEALKSINSTTALLKKEKQQKKKDSYVEDLFELEEGVKLALEVLGLYPSCTYSEILEQLKEKALIRAGMTVEELAQTVAERETSRKNKDYQTSDRIRIELEFKGIKLMDSPSGEALATSWRPCAPAKQNEKLGG